MKTKASKTVKDKLSTLIKSINYEGLRLNFYGTGTKTEVAQAAKQARG